MIRAVDFIIRSSDEQIFSYYLGSKVTLTALYKNPLRKDDNPTAGFFVTRGGLLMFHDFGTGQNWTAVTFVKDLFNLSYTDAMKRISEDKDYINQIDVGYVNKDDVQLDVVLQEDHPTYFNRYYIKPETAKLFGVYAVRAVYRNGVLHSRSTKSNPIIGYTFPSGRIKLYRPLSPDRKSKWYGNTTALDIAGWAQLPKKGSLCIITKSSKDVMVLKELGFPAISFNGESVGTGKEADQTVSESITILKKRFKKVVLLYDNDAAGVKASVVLSNRYGLPCVYLTQAKDISDLIHDRGPFKSFSILKRRISKCLKD